ncbi:MAG: type II secretion system F family protein [Actinomycetales bacterium]
MGALVGLLAGIGLALCWLACFEPAAPRPRRSHPLLDDLRDELRRAGFARVSLTGLAGVCVLLAAVIGLATYATSRSAPISVCFAVLAGWLPVALLRARVHRRQVVMRTLWPEAVDHLASGIRAGLSLPEAVAQLSERGPLPLRPAFAAFAEDYRASGRFGDCLDRLKAELADSVADRIIEALRLTREVGGNDLGRLLRTLSGFLREDARTRSELEARQSWTVNAARLAVAAPWVVLALLATRPEAVAAYNRPAGVLVLAVGAGVSVLAYRLMMRIGRLPEETRVLR